MPYKSKRQQRYMHAAAARGDLSKKVVHEFDEATKGKFEALPERVGEERKAERYASPKRRKR